MLTPIHYHSHEFKSPRYFRDYPLEGAFDYDNHVGLTQWFADHSEANVLKDYAEQSLDQDRPVPMPGQACPALSGVMSP